MGAVSVQSICAELAKELHVEAELLHEDVLSAVSQLSSMGLIVIQGKTPPPNNTRNGPKPICPVCDV